jgi:hypothetical protein
MARTVGRIFRATLSGRAGEGKVMGQGTGIENRFAGGHSIEGKVLINMLIRALNGRTAVNCLDSKRRQG